VLRVPLSPSDVQQYEAEGYLSPLAILLPDEVARYRAEEEKLQRAVAASSTPRLSAHLHLHFRWAYDLVTDPRILDVVEAILGPNILVHSSTMFGKRPGDEQYVSWHQDGYYINLNTPAFVSAWVALSESDVENGCLRVIPGSHHQGRLPHGETSKSEKNMLLTGQEVAVEIDEDSAVDLVLRPGEASLHHVDLLHGSNANRSGRPRIGFAIRYVAPHVKQALKHHPVLLARGRDEYHHYTVQERVPGGSLEEGIASMQRLAVWIDETRRSEGMPT
jgi:non-heme Fe2+,alpha-ketoglutarate-dependent halogenase